MKNTPHYKGIHPQIVATAYTLANKLLLELALPRDEFEDIVQELVIAGVKAEQIYREGKNSFSSYITERLGWVQLDLKRRYTSNKKVIYLRTARLESEMQEHHEALQELPDAQGENEILACAEFALMATSLTPQKRRMMELLRDGYGVSDIAVQLGCKEWKVREMLKQVKAAAKK